MTRTRIAFALTIALALGLAACNRPRPIEARPALFLVEDADTRIWLLGTIHALPANVRWETPAIDRAINAAQTLVTEIPDADLRGGSATFTAMTAAKGLPPALDRMPPARRPALRRAIDAAGLTMAEADALKTWALATIIGSASARTAGADRDDGVEAVLGARFHAAHKRQAAFESLRGQLALFDTLPEPEQRALLADALDDLADPQRGYAVTLNAWAAGDTARIAATFNPLLDRRPVTRDVLLAGRNRRWAAWIARRMDQPGDVLVAVGAGHLAGSQSVVAMLRAQGLPVRRVQ